MIYVVCISMDYPRKRLCLILIRSVVGKRLYRILVDYDERETITVVASSIIYSYMKYIIYVGRMDIYLSLYPFRSY